MLPPYQTENSLKGLPNTLTLISFDLFPDF